MKWRQKEGEKREMEKTNVVQVIKQKYRKHLTTKCFRYRSVIRLGFEPKTPSLKGMCSTC